MSSSPAFFFFFFSVFIILLSMWFYHYADSSSMTYSFWPKLDKLDPEALSCLLNIYDSYVFWGKSTDKLGMIKYYRLWVLLFQCNAIMEHDTKSIIFPCWILADIVRWVTGKLWIKYWSGQIETETLKSWLVIGFVNCLQRLGLIEVTKVAMFSIGRIEEGQVSFISISRGFISITNQT